MRKFSVIAVTGAVVAGLIGLAAPAQAAVLKCTQVSNVTYCEVIPNALPRVSTATSISLSQNPAAVGSTVRLSGNVSNLVSGANGNLAGTVDVRWKRWTSATTANPTVHLLTLPVAADGSFGTNLKALHTGDLQVIYSGNDSALTVNGRRPSVSNKVHLAVTRSVAASTVLSSEQKVPFTTYTSSLRNVDDKRGLNVKVAYKCSLPLGNITAQLRGANGVNVAKSTTDLGQTVGSFTFGFASSLIPDDTLRVRITTNRPCSAVISATQPAAVYTVY